MYDSTGRGNDTPIQSVDEDSMYRVCQQHTNLLLSDIEILAKVSSTLPVVHELEGGDIFIDAFDREGQAIVVAQYSPPEGNYTRCIVGEVMLRQNEPGVYRTMEIGVPSRKLKAVVSGDCLIRQNVSAIRNEDGRIIGVLIVERNVENADAIGLAPAAPAQGQAIPQSGEGPDLRSLYDAREMRHVAEFMNDGMLRFDAEGSCIYANPRAREIYHDLGYMDDLVGLSFENLCFGDYPFSEVPQRGRNEHTEIRIGEYILNVVCAPIMDDGSFTGAVLLIEDRTEEKNIEKELILKSAAIDEIHHRVKNNLQTIISLIRLQSRRLPSVEARRAFADTISRIFSISLTHEILAQKGVDDIDLKDMLSRMINSAKGFIVPENLRLSIDISGESIVLNSDIATTIAMVVNELVQNCIKHAFVGRDAGHISLDIKTGEPYCHVRVTDDGVGYTQESKRTGSLGHKLVHSLVEDKLFGELDFQTSPGGTCITFSFIADADKRKRKNKSA